MANELKTYKTYKDYRTVPPFEGEMFTKEWMLYKILTLPKDMTWLQRWRHANLYFDICANHANLGEIIDKTVEFANASEKDQYKLLREQRKRINFAKQKDKDLWKGFVR